MGIGVRDLRHRTTEVLDAVRGGETVVLTIHGRKVADTGLRRDLGELAGQTVADL